MESKTLPGFTEEKSMKAAQIKDYGSVQEMLTVENNVPIPRLSSIPKKQRHKYLILKTLAVSLAPGDVRTLSGRTRTFQGPPSFPYIPGGDCSGIVVEVMEDPKKKNSEYFQVGDFVASRFFDFPRNCMGEYAIVRKETCEKVDKSITPEEAAALASASPAIVLADLVKKGERVLVIGAGGGVGSHLCQCLREKGVSFLAGVSSDTDRLLGEPILCDAAVDYTKEDVWTKKEFLKEPFDVVIDLASGQWPKILKHSKQKETIFKSASKGGRFLTVTMDEPYFTLLSVWDAFKVMLFPLLGRGIKSRTYRRWSLPKFSFVMGLPEEREVITKVLKNAQEKKLQTCIDDVYEFNTKDVQNAFLVQESHHTKGKLVIKISDQ